MINLSSDTLLEVKKILSEYIPDAEVSVFGSRINGQNKKYSDLDLAVRMPENKKLDQEKLNDLNNAFSESNIPIMIDIIDLNTVSDSFREIVLENREIIQQ